MTPVGFCSWKTLLIKNNKKRKAALKNEAGGDKMFFFYVALCKKGESVRTRKNVETIVTFTLVDVDYIYM